MIRTSIGKDYEGVWSVKITKGTEDPRDIHDSRVGMFLYNSKWSKDIQLSGVVDIPYYATSFQNANFGVYATSGGVNRLYMTAGYLGGSDYAFPIFDVKERASATGRYQSSRTRLSRSGFNRSGGVWKSGPITAASWFQNYVDVTSIHPKFPYLGYAWCTQTDDDFYDPTLISAVLWNLPSDESVIQNGTPQPQPQGLRVAEITPAACRVAKPGFDVRNATSSQLAFDSSKRPPKIIAAADVAVPTGVSSYDVGYAIPVGSVPDVYFYDANDALYFPTNPTNGETGAEYWISGTSLFFNNPSGACRARFIIIGGAGEPATAGNNRVWREIEANGQKHIQFLKPGSSLNPSFTDIILDSRWPALQIVQEGYIPVADGNQQYVVPISTAGLFPIVKYTTVHGAGSRNNSETWTKETRQAVTKRIGHFTTGWNYDGDAGDSTYCRLTATEARFYTFKGRPIRVYYSSQQNYDQNRLSADYDPSPILGIRYYIFGIPA